MPSLLFEHLPHLEPRLRSAGRVLLFTDFDGTLVPICDSPLKVELSTEVRHLLTLLAARPRVGLAVVSGRDLADLLPRVGVIGIGYAGNHGLEISAPGLTFTESAAAALSAELTGLVAELAIALADVPGAWVQDKGLTASVHYRTVAADDIDRVKATVERVTRPVHDRFVLRDGKMVREVRPAVDWHKGRAVRWLTEALAGGHPDPLPIYLGDDHTDEDAFAALPDGITVYVGRRRSTAAQYRVDTPDDVAAFLRWLHDVL